MHSTLNSWLSLHPFSLPSPNAFPRSPFRTVTLCLSRPCELPIHHDRSPGEGKPGRF
jgi:hypothetical protein